MSIDYLDVSGALAAVVGIYNGVIYLLPPQKALQLTKWVGKNLGPIGRFIKFLASTPGGFKLK